jgi:hypothetical protein
MYYYINIRPTSAGANITPIQKKPKTDGTEGSEAVQPIQPVPITTPVKRDQGSQISGADTSGNQGGLNQHDRQPGSGAYTKEKIPKKKKETPDTNTDSTVIPIDELLFSSGAQEILKNQNQEGEDSNSKKPDEDEPPQGINFIA